MILPEVLDESKWWQGKHRWTDAEGRYAFVFLGNPQRGGVSYNTKLIQPREFQSFWDFVDPKLKGRIEARDIRASGPGSPSFQWTSSFVPQAQNKFDGDGRLTGEATRQHLRKFLEAFVAWIGRLERLAGQKPRIRRAWFCR
jgi:hypothetical protein